MGVSGFIHVLDKFNTYCELENYVESLPKKLLKPLKCAVSKFKPLKHLIDNVAKLSIPKDCTRNLIPVFIIGDGNCYPRSLSCAAFGNDSRHVLLRAKIVVEGVYKKQRYLDNNYMSMGSNSLRTEGSYSEQMLCSLANMPMEILKTSLNLFMRRKCWRCHKRIHIWECGKSGHQQMSLAGQ